MRIPRVVNLMTVVILVAGCASLPSHEKSPKTSAGIVAPFLVELHFRESWQRDTCYVVTYTSSERSAEVLVTGKRHDHYRLSLIRAQALERFAETELLKHASEPNTCEDCTEYEILVRLDRAHNFFVVEEAAARPAVVERLLELIEKR